MSALTKNNLPLIIGHRGASAFAPENTMAAFNLAIESGADGIEFDVRLSRDQIPVIIHDDTLLEPQACITELLIYRLRTSVK